MSHQPNGHLLIPEGSPDTPASYYYDEGDISPLVPEEIVHKLREIDRTGGITSRIVDGIAQEVRERREMIGGIDHLWIMLQNVTDFNPVCTLVSTMRGHVTVEMMAEQVRKKAEKFPRYRQRLEGTGRLLHGATFVDDPDFDVLNHIHVRRLPEPAGKEELDAVVGEFVGEPWDLSRPLWDMILVENYHDDYGAVCAVVARGHHTLADGQGFVISQLYMTSYYDDLRQMMDGAATKLRNAKRGLLLPSEYNPALKPLDPYASNHSAAPFVHLFLELLFWLTLLFSTIISFFWGTYQSLRLVVFVLFTFWRIEMVVDEPPDGAPRSALREFSSSRVFSLREVKLCQQAFSGPRPGFAVAGVPKNKRKNARSEVGHVTVNDVMCSVMADVLAQEIAAKPEPRSPWGRMKRAVNSVLQSPIPFFIPISIRAPGDWSMQNISTGSNVYLYPSRTLTPDISIREIHAHIHRCRYELSLLKHSIWPKFFFYVLQLTGQAPALFPLSWFPKNMEDSLVVRFMRRWVVKPFTDACLQSFTAILTNVPGPAKKHITMAGVEIGKWKGTPPQGGAGTLGIGILSYAGGISIAVSADLVPASQGVARRICEKFERRFELYVARAKQVLNHQQ
ncbi:wax ester synthase-like acyl-CoA acyltransferase domain-containing protein [Trametes punicea]|nr:wax ester synthase-like acyl-CoA acyltransferase domain-containing protein [Trametes punicea]